MKEMQDNDRCWWWLASLFMVAMLVLIATGCSREETVPVSTEEGLLATIRIDVNAHEPATPQTRAVDEDAIHDLHVLVYNSAGELIGKNYATTTSSIVVKARSGKGCTIYVIANTNNATLWDGAVTTEAKLKALTTESLTTWNELTNSAYLVMTGSKENVDIAAGSSTIGSISVARIAAKVTLNIGVEPGSGITITDYQICDLPTLSYYIARPMTNEAETPPGTTTDPDTSGSGDDAVKPATAEHWINSGDITTPTNSTTVNASFYMYENRRGVNSAITEQKDKNSTNAFTKSTYIEIKGISNTYKATWRIYLGSNNTNNYNIKRNSSYTYNITLGLTTVDTRVDVGECYDGVPSNCYMVLPGHSVTIPVVRANESPIQIGSSTTQLSSTTNWVAEIVWQSSVQLVTVSNNTGIGPSGRFKVTATDTSTSGNAVVCIKQGSTTGPILWSWHIWITTYTGTYRLNIHNGKRTFIFMDRNLGATSATPGQLSSCGLMYQWGRKDPLPGIGETGGNWSIPNGEYPISLYNARGVSFQINQVPTPNIASNNLTNATRNPVTFYYGGNTFDWFAYSSSYQNSNLWSGINTALTTAAKKSAFDPCPDGWRIPPWLNNTSPFAGIGGSEWSWGDYGENWNGKGGYFPASGMYASHTTGLYGVNNNGLYWSGSPDGASQAYCMKFTIGIEAISTAYTTLRAGAFPIRCCQDNL